jgi:hypothetical protein
MMKLPTEWKNLKKKKEKKTCSKAPISLNYGESQAVRVSGGFSSHGSEFILQY